jgi:hypothetical protein
MIQIDKSKPLIFLGDHHGAWTSLFHNIAIKDIENCNIISVGDLGIGFSYTNDAQYRVCEKLSEKFKERNIHFFGIRGNHDNPFFFEKKHRVDFENFQLIEDYTLGSYGDQQIQFIGGAISVDRVGRQVDISYWENERVAYNANKCKPVDILVTHTAPSWCFPQKFNEIVYGWAKEDAYLIEDLNEERGIVDEIFKVCNPRFHVYGHFHSSWTETIGICKHKLLNIEEMFEYRG